MQHVVYAGGVLGLAANTIEGRLAAVVRLHILEGFVIDRSTMPLLALIVKGLKRVQGGCKRKHAVTIDILREIRRMLDLNNYDDAVTWAATLTAFFNLLRSVEYSDTGAGPDTKMCLRNAHFSLRVDGKAIDLTKGWTAKTAIPDEMLIHIPYSKTDALGQGRELNLFASPGNDLCVVAAMVNMWRLRPHTFSRPDDFLFRTAANKCIKKDAVQARLRKAAASCEAKYDPADYSSHSLRSGGATAMYHADVPIEDIQRRGRWKSDCWRIYIFGDRNRARGLLDKMTASCVELFRRDPERT